MSRANLWGQVLPVATPRRPTVHRPNGRDFEFEPVCLTKRRVDAKWEEELQVHWLRGLNQQLPQLSQQEPWLEYTRLTQKPLVVPRNLRPWDSKKAIRAFLDDRVRAGQ